MAVSESYLQLVYVHLATIIPAFMMGTYLLARRKGTPMHRKLGRGYMLLMLSTAVITLLMPAEVGPRFLNHFGFIHLLSVLVVVTVPVAWFAIRNGQRITHQISMISLYVGGLLIAGSFTLMPGRLMHQWLFG